MSAASARVPYGGVATRAVALAVDAVLSQLAVVAGFAVGALVSSLVGEVHLGPVAQVVVVCAWVAVVAGYFVFFWSATGQTPGMRLMGLRVAGSGGEPLSLARSLVRVVGLALAIAPAFAGFLPVLIDDRRRGLHDFLARTVVYYDQSDLPDPSEAPRTQMPR